MRARTGIRTSARTGIPGVCKDRNPHSLCKDRNPQSVQGLESAQHVQGQESMQGVQGEETSFNDIPALIVNRSKMYSMKFTYTWHKLLHTSYFYDIKSLHLIEIYSIRISHSCLN